MSIGVGTEDEEVGKFAVSSELGGRESVLGMGLHAFSSSGLS